MLNTVNSSNLNDFIYTLSDGTVVEPVKITSRDRVQVHLPDSHYLSYSDPVRIFARDGNHYQDATDGLTLTATPKVTEVVNDVIDNGSVVVINGVAYSLYAIGPVVDLAA